MFWNRQNTKNKIEKVELIDFGFRITFNEIISEIKWEEINKLVGFKIDRITTDDICLKIESHKIVSFVTEEFLGWSEFVTELLKHFPEINKNWEGIIAKTAFERNETQLYNREKNGG